MGKQSRRASRRGRHTPKPAGLRTTIAVAPQMDPDDSSRVVLSTELRLARSALLYSDQVDLLAPSVSILWDFVALRDVDEDNMLRRMAQLNPPALHRLGVPQEHLGNFKRIMRRASKQRPGGSLRDAFEADWLPVLDDIRGNAHRALAPEDAEALHAAKQAGALNIIGDKFTLEGDTDEQIEWFIDRLAAGLSDPASALLLDAVTASRLREDGALNFAEAAISVSAKKATLGTQLIEHLPAFPDAPMTSVLEARSDLTDERTKYRNVVAAFSQRLASAPLDESLPHEVDTMWHDEVRPALNDLKKSLSATRVAYDTGKTLATTHLNPASISVTLSAVGNFVGKLPDTAALGAAAGGVAATAVVEAFRARSEYKSHELVYLAHLDKRLGR